jgi:hypothetical protein
MFMQADNIKTFCIECSNCIKEDNHYYCKVKPIHIQQDAVTGDVIPGVRKYCKCSIVNSGDCKHFSRNLVLPEIHLTKKYIYELDYE